MLIGVTKDGVRFSTQGDIGSANVTLRCISSSDEFVKTSYALFNTSCSVEIRALCWRTQAVLLDSA